MNNYIYIKAGLPELTPDWRQGSQILDDHLALIKELLSEKDNEVIDFIIKGFDKDQIGLEFYKEAENHNNSFIREYFLFDFMVRNTKVKYLNKELGRESQKDVIPYQDICQGEYGIEPEEIEFNEEAKLQSILEGKDILARERAIDDIYWDKIDELTILNYLDFESILAVVVKMQIIKRWLILDEQTGREMFKRLVDEVRGTFKGVEYTE